MFFVLALSACVLATETPIFKGGFLDGWNLEEIGDKIMDVVQVLNETVLSGTFNPEDIVRIKNTRVVTIDDKKFVKFDVSYDSEELENVILQAKILASKIVGYEEAIGSIDVTVPRSQTTTVTIPVEPNSAYDFFQTISIERLDDGTDKPVDLTIKNVRLIDGAVDAPPADSSVVVDGPSDMTGTSDADKKENGGVAPAVCALLLVLLHFIF